MAPTTTLTETVTEGLAAGEIADQRPRAVAGGV